MLSAVLEFFKMFLKNLLAFHFSIKCFFKSLLLQTKKCNFFASFFFWGGGGGGKFTSQPTIQDLQQQQILVKPSNLPLLRP